MPEIITQSIQDYLKHIYELNEHGGTASTNDLAARLNIAPASVTGMLQRLGSSKPPLVIYKKHQGVTLTRNGEKPRWKSFAITAFLKLFLSTRWVIHGMKSIARRTNLSM